MIRVYVAGPYSAPTPEGIERNVQTAIDAGHALMDAGFCPYVPHLSHYMEARRPRPYEDWMAIDFEWVAASQALLRIPGASSGADREADFAEEIGVPVFHSMDELLAWTAA